MGAVAAAFRELGFIVTGSDDNVYPPMSTFLEAKGIKISTRIQARKHPIGGGSGGGRERPLSRQSRT